MRSTAIAWIIGIAVVGGGVAIGMNLSKETPAQRQAREEFDQRATKIVQEREAIQVNTEERVDSIEARAKAEQERLEADARAKREQLDQELAEARQEMERRELSGAGAAVAPATAPH